MLTTQKIDKPVAAYLRGIAKREYVPTGDFLYFSEDVHPPLPAKVRKLMIQHYDMLPPEGDEVECEHPHEKSALLLDKMRGSYVHSRLPELWQVILHITVSQDIQDTPPRETSVSCDKVEYCEG